MLHTFGADGGGYGGEKSSDVAGRFVQPVQHALPPPQSRAALLPACGAAEFSCSCTWSACSSSDGAWLVLQMRLSVAAAMLAAAPSALAFTTPVGSLASPVKTLHSRYHACGSVHLVPLRSTLRALTLSLALSRAPTPDPSFAFSRAPSPSHSCPCHSRSGRMVSPVLRSRKSAALALRAQQYNEGPREEGLSPLSGGGFSRS
jgi:hypothetical protein